MDAREEILKKVANNHSYETWGELMYDSHEHWQIHCTKEAMEEYASPLKERIKELEDENKRKINDWENCIKDIQILQSQLQEADSKAVRFAGWKWKEGYFMQIKSNVWRNSGTKPDKTTLELLKEFEIFEQENK